MVPVVVVPSLSMLAADPGWSVDERRAARDARLKMSLRFEELDAYLEQEFPYVLAENLLPYPAACDGRIQTTERAGVGAEARPRFGSMETHALSQLLRGHPGSGQAGRGRGRLMAPPAPPKRCEA